MEGDEKRYPITQETPVKEYANLPEIRVILIGKTGNGKSATGNTILGWKFFVSTASAESVTSEGNMGKMKWKGRIITVVDTPGIFDTIKEEKPLLIEIMKSWGLMAPGPHIILFITSTIRQTEEEKNVQGKLAELFKKFPYNHMAVCFTRKDDLVEDGVTESKFLEKCQHMKDLVTRCNENVLFLDNRLKDLGDITEQWNRLYSIFGRILDQNNGCHYSDALLETIEDNMEKIESKQLLDLSKSSAQSATKQELRVNNQWNISQNGYVLGFLYSSVAAGCAIIVGIIAKLLLK